MNTLDLVKRALEEDMPQGDVTTEGLKLQGKKGKARLVAKQDLCLSGQEPFTLAFENVTPPCRVKWHFKDGDKIPKGSLIAEIEGEFASLLKAERTALNFLGRLSGIATMTHKFFEATKGSKTKILDTRKTTPLLRMLEKKAVKDGGGTNHRIGLSDAILVKENHIRAAGNIKNAVDLLRRSSKLPIEVEVTSFEELRECLALKVEKVLLDNMSTDQMRTCVEMVKKAGSGCLTEASGNMNLARIPEVCATGVDFISVGALTHSAPVADVSLLFEIEN